MTCRGKWSLFRSIGTAPGFCLESGSINLSGPSPGNLIVAPFGLSFRFPTLRPPSSATGGGGLQSQPSTMYARRLEMIWSMIIISSHKRKQITSAPPGVFPWLFCVHWTPPRENLAKYDVCMWLETTRTTRSLSGPKRNQPHIRGADFFLESGNVLLSRVVSNQVPSALKGLTSVFGMGTGGSLSP